MVLHANALYRAGRGPVFPLPDLKDADNRAAFITQVRPVIGGLSADVVAADGDAYLGAVGGAAARRRWRSPASAWAAGRLAHRALHPGRVAALASFHGGNLAVADNPESPHGSARCFDAELFFAHADQDHSMTAEQIELLEQALGRPTSRTAPSSTTAPHHGWTMFSIRPSTTRPRGRRLRSFRAARWTMAAPAAPAWETPVSSPGATSTSRRKREQCRRAAAARAAGACGGEVVPVARALLRRPHAARPAERVDGARPWAVSS